MAELQQNRYDQLLRRVGDLKGPGSKVNDALGELFPMIDVENVPAELLILMGSRLCMGTAAFAAGGVGNFAQVFLRNPGASGSLLRLVSVSAWSSGQTTLVLGPTQNSSTPVGNRAFVDGRIFGEGTVGIIQGRNNFLAAGSTFFRIRLRAQVAAIWEPPTGMAVITPGTAFSVGTETDDESLEVGFLWVERVAQPSELNL